jgi:3',5'-cyclic AMP phosphodiesterase CpdA
LVTEHPTRTTIVHISDLHLEAPETEQYPNLGDRLSRIQRVISDVGADLVVATGDLTNRGSSTPADFDLARRWLDGLSTPYLTLAGNHDLGPNVQRGSQFPLTERFEDCAFPDTGFGRAFGGGPVSSTRVGDLTVLALSLREDDRDSSLEMLAKSIAEAPGPVIVAGHYPVVPPRPSTEQDAFGFYGYVDPVSARLRDLLGADDRVIAYLCGHVHLISLQRVARSCVQFTSGGLGPGPAAFRIYRWDGVKLDYSTHDVEGPDVFWETGSEQAASDPNFSSGTQTERRGVWLPTWSQRQPSTRAAAL